MDSLDHDAGRVFSIPDLWRPSTLLDLEPEEVSCLFSAQQLHDTKESKLTDIGIPQCRDGFFRLPDFSNEVFADENTPGNSAETLENVDVPATPDATDNDDIWLFRDEDPVKTASYLSWNAFNNGNHDSNTTYVTEAGRSVFDLVAAGGEEYLKLGQNRHMIVDTRLYISALLALGLGRSSVLFIWNNEKRVFEPATSGMRISGFTAESLHGVSTVFIECGNNTRALRKFVDITYAKDQSPSRIALADAVASVLSTIQAELQGPSTALKSVLKLQALFLPVRSVLECFNHLVTQVKKTKNDESMLSTIFEEAQQLEHRTGSLKHILYEVLAQVSKPWLEIASEWVGVRRDTRLPIAKEAGRSFIQVAEKEGFDDQGLELRGNEYVFDSDRLPSFLGTDNGRMLFETGKSLRFLKDHHAEHPLANADVVASADPPSLEWKFRWEDILQLEAKALDYEMRLKAAINNFHKNPPTTTLTKPHPDFGLGGVELDFYGKSDEEMHAHLIASIDTFNRPVHKVKQDLISTKIKAYLDTSFESSSGDDSIFVPPIHLTSLLSFNPVIAAQARMVNLISMRLLFASHNLREHLSLQQSFQLLGNGVFSARLSHALFDSELESAERHQGVARSGRMMGLRLGGRDTWPPASSELRLALMGVLTESYFASKASKYHCKTGNLNSHRSLPGDISFAVRDMSREEIERCMNADSVEALDFLRLSYKPPAALESVITPTILSKYDRIFKLLLRIIRMLYVVSSLFRDTSDRTSSWQRVNIVTQRFRIEAQHFVSSVSGYFFDTGIETTWRVFERKLDHIEAIISVDGDTSTLLQCEGLDKLRDYHERIVNRMMFSLLSRKRQQPVMKQLEEIFGVILRFSKVSRESSLRSQIDEDTNHTIIDLYREFRKKVGVFLVVCKGLCEKSGYSEKKSSNDIEVRHDGLFGDDGLDDGNTIIQLITKLEMSNFYTKQVNI